MSTIAGTTSGAFSLRVPGAHNVRNATAAIAVGIGLDIPVEADSPRAGRLQRRGPPLPTAGQLPAALTVIDDYGHHPTEIRATLAAARQCGFQRCTSSFSRIAIPAPSCCWMISPRHFATPIRFWCSTSILPASRRLPASPAELLAKRITETRRARSVVCAIVRRSGGYGHERRAARRHDPDPGRRQHLAARPAGAGATGRARRDWSNRARELMRDTLQMINEMQAAGVIGMFAIGGAVGARSIPRACRDPRYRHICDSADNPDSSCQSYPNLRIPRARRSD